MRAIWALLLALALPCAPLSAQQVSGCGGHEARAQNLMEPWDENSRSFSGGRTRLAVLDTIEPALGAFYVMILSPPFDPLGARQCRVVGLSQAMGFARIRFDALASAYDPLSGLSFDLPVEVYDAAQDAPVPKRLRLSVNQASGEITAQIEAAQ